MSNIADVKSKTIKIALSDGVQRTLKFTLNALAELEERYGSVQIAFDKLEKENSMKALRCILWAGFLHETPDLTEQEVGNLIDVAYMQELVGSLNLALEQDLAPNEVEEPSKEGVQDPNA